MWSWRTSWKLKSWEFFVRKRNFLWLGCVVSTLLACGDGNASAVSTTDGDSSVTLLDSISEFITQNPRDASALAFRAGLHLENKNLPYAKADAEASLALDSGLAAAHLRMGEVYFLSNQTRNSKLEWEKCIALDPATIECRLKLAELYSIVQEHGKSNELVDKVMELDPRNPIAYYIKGLNIRDGKGDTVMALKYIQKAIDLDPSYAVALDMAGVLHAALKSPLATGYFQRLIELDPSNFNAHYNLGMFYLGQRDFNPAIETFTLCSQLDPKNPEPFFNLGFIHLELNLIPEARSYFGQSIQAREVNYRAYYGRAYCAEKTGDVASAESDYRKALSYNPQHLPSREGLKRIVMLRAR